MKNKLLLKGLAAVMLLFGISASVLRAQTVDTTNVFDPPLTDVHLIYAEVIYNDTDADGVFDASFNLSPIEITAWGDYCTSIAFYAGGLEIRNQAVSGFVKTAPYIIPVPGEVMKLWIALNVPGQTYKAYAQTESMAEPQIIYDGDATFRNTAVESGINRWSALHNPDTEVDSLSVLEVSLVTNSDASLKSMSADVGTLNPVFSPDKTEYTLDVPYGTTNIQLDATANGMGATVQMFAGTDPVTDGNVAFTGDGVDVEIIVTAFDGTQSTYYVSIYVSAGASDARLSEISVSETAIDPMFDPDIFSYTMVVPQGTTSVDVSATPNYETATVTGTGSVTLSGGTGTATLNVESADQTATNTYTISIREADGNNYALYLPGGDGNNSNIDISGLPLGAHPYSIEMWFKPEGTQNYNAGLFYQRPHNIGLQYVSSWQTPRDRVRFMTGVTDNYGTTSANITPDAWHHMVAVLTDSFRIVYLDGEMNSEKIESPVLDYSDGQLFIGWDNNTSDKAFKGYIDEIRIWNDSLTAEAIEANRLEVLNGDEANLLAYWNFDLNSPNVAIDLSSTGKHAAISGGTYAASFPRVNLDLSSLEISVGNMKPVFNKGVSEYYVTLPKGTTSLDVTAVADGTEATVSGDGTITLSEPRGTITVTVSATSGESKDYNIHWVLDTDLTLMHSYTFANGTAMDEVGGVHGDVQSGAINSGVFTSSAEGDYIKLDGSEITLKEYPSITLEAYVMAGDNADNYTMFAYFGGLQSSNSLWIQLSRPTDASRLELNTGGDMTYVESLEPGIGENHHYVGIATNDSIVWYIDGMEMAKAENLAKTMIPGIDATNGWLGYGGWNDPTWMGSIYEFNIYSGVMDESTISARSVTFPIEDETTDATLSDLTIDGTTVTDFASYKTDYTVVLPITTTTVPTVAATPKISGASVVVTQATELPGNATVLVTASDGSTTLEYTVKFEYEASEDATLSDIQVDGTSIEGFSSATFDYTFYLPRGTETVPTVTATATDGAATVVVTPAAQVPGTTTIDVTAGDESSTEQYTVFFDIEISNDASLSDLQVDGSTIENFSPSTLAYTYFVPPGTTTVPTVTVTTTNEYATYVINDASAIQQTTTIMVTAEDEATVRTYGVYFDFGDAVKDEIKGQVKVYPSVSNGNFTVETADGLNTLTLYNIAGVVVEQLETLDSRIQLQTKDAGLYILKVEYGNTVETFRLIHSK